MFDFNQRQNGGILRTHVTIGMFYYRPKLKKILAEKVNF